MSVILSSIGVLWVILCGYQSAAALDKWMKYKFSLIGKNKAQRHLISDEYHSKTRYPWARDFLGSLVLTVIGFSVGTATVAMIVLNASVMLSFLMFVKYFWSKIFVPTIKE